jgi:uncharacterized protein (DUF885 family)
VRAADAPATPSAPPSQAWIQESNRFADRLIEVGARYVPESASSSGVEAHDAEVADLKPRYVERNEADLDAIVADFKKALPTQTDPRVRQDLQILIDAGTRNRDSLEVNRQLMLPYADLSKYIFQSFHALLDPRVSKKRQAAALIRLKRYAGTEKGYEPVATLYRARMEEGLRNAALVGPWIVEVDQDLKNPQQFAQGTRDLFQKSGLQGWEHDLDTLNGQLAQLAQWTRETVVPRARKTNQLPPKIYADNLKQVGVDMDPHELIDRALYVYSTTREEMAEVASGIAARRGMKSADYHEVLRELKKDRIPNDKLIEVYNDHLKQIEDIVRREHLVTLPSRKAVIRLATDAESAAQPAPHMSPPRLIGNTGERGEFVLPTSNPNADSGEEENDFNYQAVTWDMIAHEARPGHELQFAKMIERGVSNARAIFAFNSANVEGWALYSEAIMKQYLSPEAQLAALQMRLMRAARAYLDPMLNLGLIDPAAAKRLLMEDVVLSEPMAKQEVDRYTFNSPGQATSYFYGYIHMEALRARVELTLGKRFHPQAFHDFMIDQGLLPVKQLEQAVLEQFVPSQQARPAAAATRH